MHVYLYAVGNWAQALNMATNLLHLSNVERSSVDQAFSLLHVAAVMELFGPTLTDYLPPLILLYQVVPFIISSSLVM